jgi:hypothetical protein
LRKESLQDKARAAGFVRRESKLTADVFLEMMLYCSSLEDCSSLSSMCSVLEESGVKMRKQSLNGRFNAFCTDFVKSVLIELLEEQLQQAGLYKGDFWEHFPCVRIKDSTKFKVPDLMKEQFKGNGGSAAGICIQYEYDLVTGKILYLDVGSGGGNDRTDASQTREQPQEGELVIRDLGYHSLDVFQTFADNHVRFLSRLHSKTVVYYPSGEKDLKEVDFEKLYRQMLDGHIEQMEMDAVLGKKYKLPVRMAFSLVDEKVYEKRIREREAENRKRGQTMSDETRIRYRFSIYITNATPEQLPVELLFSAYRLRWQIELAFKSWKSLYRVHIFREMKQDRYLCMLYAKLILPVINLQLTRCLERGIQRVDRNGERQYLSTHKVLSTLRKCFSHILCALFGKSNNVRKTLLYYWTKMSNNHWKDRKKDKRKPHQINPLML